MVICKIKAQDERYGDEAVILLAKCDLSHEGFALKGIDCLWFGSNAMRGNL
jgi:hypothetical protein